MRKAIFTAAAALTLVSGSALSADLSYRKAPTPAAVVAQNFDWSGLYVGIQGGYGWGHVNWTYNGIGTTANHDTGGGLFGGTLGYNWQSGNWVFGIETDGAWAHISGSTACPNPAFSCRSTLNSFSTARGRLGMAWGQWMLYGTAGAAGAGQNIRTVVTATGATAGTDIYGVGWTAGGGVEYMFAPNWSLKAEA
ncbi:MAG: porin family protein, partial [Variibacter sp.]|nr:porin family protein [Variibacter sp.]